MEHNTDEGAQSRSLGIYSYDSFLSLLDIVKYRV